MFNFYKTQNMKRLVIILLLVTFCFSCKEKELTSDDLFLEYLKENSIYFEKCSKDISESYTLKSNRILGFEEVVKQHNEVKFQIDSFLNEIKTKDKTDKIKLQEEFVKKINNLKVKIKLPILDRQKLAILNNQQLYLYIKSSFYKSVSDGFSKIRFPCR